MSYVTTRNKVWDKNLIKKLTLEVDVKFYLVTEKDAGYRAAEAYVFARESVD